jgi:ketosteroid isomerase-like protein
LIVNEQDLKDAEAATRRFYDAIIGIVTGKGMAEMDAIWEHSERVTSKHPMGEWCTGWEEVKATWEITSDFASPAHEGATLVSTRLYVYGDMAYATSIFQIAPSAGGDRLLCTNVLHKSDGKWKIVHHHADPAPNMMAALERLAAQA